MRMIDVFTPSLNIVIRYRSISDDDIDTFVRANAELQQDDYMKKVLEWVVYNLRTDVLDQLKDMDRKIAREHLEAVYHGCVMINPGLDVTTWLEISQPKNADNGIGTSIEIKKTSSPSTKSKSSSMTRAKILGLEEHLKSRIVGQPEAISAVSKALKRSMVGLQDEGRPLGVFVFAGSSGVGKSQLAKELHSYLFDKSSQIVRIDCGEYQHKHENQKLLGAPQGYSGYEDGGFLTNQMKKNPKTIVLLDEAEKAHPDIWNTFLRVFDDGVMTDNQGKTISFQESIIIMTTNLGNKEILESMSGTSTGFGSQLGDIKRTDIPKRTMVEKKARDAIKKSFRPEFLNRIDKIIVFNHLEHDDYTEIAALEMQKVADKLSKRGVTLDYDVSILTKLIELGVNAVEGARGMTRVRRDFIEDAISDAIIEKKANRGSIVQISWHDEDCEVAVKKPQRKKKKASTD